MNDSNMALLIDPDTRDLDFDDEGLMQCVYGDDTTAQCVRLTLQTWLAEFFLDITHGTEYERILGKKPPELPHDEIGEVLRSAILQEHGVAQVDSVKADIEGRVASAHFVAKLNSGRTISTEVTTNGHRDRMGFN